MTILPIKGTDNSVADALSRIGFRLSLTSSEARVNTVDLLSGFDMKVAQQNDPDLANNKKPENIQKNASYVVRTLWHKFDSLRLENGVLVRTPPQSPVTQQIVPCTLR